MQALNLTLFGWLAAGFEPSAFWLPLAAAVARNSSWLCVALLAWAAWRMPSQRWHVLTVMVSAGIVSMLSHKLAQLVGMPRPFMVGLSPNYIEHGVRGALPSTHATVMFTMASMFLLRPPLRHAGWLLLAVAMGTGLARVHVGGHFPLDIAAGALLGAGVAVVLNTALTRLQGFGVPRSGHLAIAGRLSSVVADGRFSLVFVLLFALAAIGIGLRAPDVFPMSSFTDGGALKHGTLLFYLAALVMVATLRLPFVRAADKLATTVVLLAFAAREADLLSGWLASSPGIAALALLAPVALAFVLSIGWLARRYRQSWRLAVRQKQWRPAVYTVLILSLVTVFTLTAARMPDAMRDFGILAHGPSTLGQLLVSLVQILELAVPMLGMLAFHQAKFGHRPSSN